MSRFFTELDEESIKRLADSALARSDAALAAKDHAGWRQWIDTTRALDTLRFALPRLDLMKDRLDALEARLAALEAGK